MLFNSLNFIVFFPVMLAVYHLIPERFRYIWLLVSSWFFYACFSLKCVPILLGITLVSYMGGRMLDSAVKNEEKKRKTIFIVCLTVCLLALGAFKYLDFFISNINAVLNIFHISVLPAGYSLLMPAGISFYTFKSIGYMADVYRGKVHSEKDFLKYALFVSFFPQIAAGPIDRADSLLTQIRGKLSPTDEDFRRGALLMLWGYFEKLLIADRIAVLVDAVYDNHMAYSGAAIMFATLLYGIQIYADFAGYSHLAIGASSILGIKVGDNFRQPYLAVNIRDFWSRWHISMSAWFRDYLYIPLGGNRKGKLRKHVNNMITFLLSGLWHGASWNFVIWGGIHGLYHVFAALTGKVRAGMAERFKIDRTVFGYRLFKTVLTFIMVDYAWLFFRAGSLRIAFDMTVRMVTDLRPYTLAGDHIYSLGLPEAAVRTILPGCLMLLAADILREKGISIMAWLDKQGIIFRWICYICSVLIVILIAVQNLGMSSAGFIYFKF